MGKEPAAPNHHDQTRSKIAFDPAHRFPSPSLSPLNARNHQTRLFAATQARETIDLVLAGGERSDETRKDLVVSKI